MAMHTAAPEAPAGGLAPSKPAAPAGTGESWEGAQVRGHVRPVSGYTRADLVRALARFRQIDTALGVRLLVVDLLMIAGGFALVLLAVGRNCSSASSASTCTPARTAAAGS